MSKKFSANSNNKWVLFELFFTQNLADFTNFSDTSVIRFTLNRDRNPSSSNRLIHLGQIGNRTFLQYGQVGIPQFLQKSILPPVRNRGTFLYTGDKTFKFPSYELGIQGGELFLYLFFLITLDKKNNWTYTQINNRFATKK